MFCCMHDLIVSQQQIKRKSFTLIRYREIRLNYKFENYVNQI